jgi:phosphate-selective porin OprO/OprP
VLTGEKASFEGIRPLRNFDPGAGAWGAVEVAARLSRLDIDSDTFPTFADPAKQARRANEWVVGGNWYFNPAVKLNLDYSHVTFEGGAAGGKNRPDEETLLTRTQFRF